MSNPIRPYAQVPLQAYGPALQPPAPAPARPTPPAEATSAPPQAARSVSEPSGLTSGLSAAEQQMIERFFPPEPRMTLKLYGPGRGAHTLDPSALGTRLDLRG